MGIFAGGAISQGVAERWDWLAGYRAAFVVAGAAELLCVAVALPFLIDVNRYRGLIEEQAEAALGREVQLGEMQLSLLPSEPAS